MGVLRCHLLVNTNGGGVPPGSPNLDPISDQKMLFFTPGLWNPYPFSELALKNYVIITYRWEQQQKRFSHLKSKQLGSYTPVVPLKTIPDSRPEWVKSITLFRPKGRKSPTLRGRTYLYGLYRGVPPRVQKRGLCATSQLNCSGRGAPYNYDGKKSSHKCCTAALCNNRSGDKKELPFHVFPNDPCETVTVNFSTVYFQIHVFCCNCSRNIFCG